jgi:hypothetical protein
MLLVALTACKDKNQNTPATTTELITANGWALDRITTADKQTISTNRLNASTALIFGLDIQFRDNNIVRASDKVSKQIINAGTWFLVDSDKFVDVNVTGFKGKFEISEISRTKLVLKNKVPVSGVDTDALMEFVPNL